jgi:hypothetical protein
MSFYRFVYYSAVIAGWAALAAWVLAELLFLGNRHLGGTLSTTAAAATLGAMIGAGLNLVAGMANAQWKQQLRRILAGLLVGGLGGLVGGLLGEILYADLGLPRFLGWMIMGLGIGAADGLYDRSTRKIRNGLIGGGLGGLLGGLLFDLIASAAADMPGRATGFVILGLSVGALIGLAQVVLKEAWLTVLDGFRPGRQLILGQGATLLGHGDHLPLPFLGYSGRELENEHLRISRQSDGRFAIEDNRSRAGTFLNGQRLDRPALLGDGDLIKLGGNIVRFNHRQRNSGEPCAVAARPLPAIPLPPAPPSVSATAPGPPSSGVTPGAPVIAGGTVAPRLPLPPSRPWNAPNRPQPAQDPPPGTAPRIPPPPPPKGKDEG